MRGTIEPFTVVGISQIVSNEKGQAAHAINGLWTRFYNESIVDLIPAKQGAEVYAVYSDYEGDHTKPYRITIGCRSEAMENILPSLHAVQVDANDYEIFTAAGEQPQALIETWQKIWDSATPRAFNTDFEIYGPRFFQAPLHEVLVYIGIKP
jgi:predicted transcriptional regulator YdeE